MRSVFGALHLHDCASLFAVAESRYAELMLACTIDVPTCCRYDTGSYAAYVLGDFSFNLLPLRHWKYAAYVLGDFSFIYLQVSTTRGGGGGRDGHDCTTLTINSRALGTVDYAASGQIHCVRGGFSSICSSCCEFFVCDLLQYCVRRCVACLPFSC